MSIYTRTGDRGQTGLLGGERVAKSDPRVEAYGDVDELNAAVGLVRAHLPEGDPGPGRELPGIQSHLCAIGSRLAATDTGAHGDGLPTIGEADVAFLERAIDRMTAALPPLRSFILPGGHPGAAWAHLARTVCRRAERRVVALLAGTDDPGHQQLLAYLNRLSDYLFVLARHCNHLAGREETPWKPE